MPVNALQLPAADETGSQAARSDKAPPEGALNAIRSAAHRKHDSCRSACML